MRLEPGSALTVEGDASAGGLVNAGNQIECSRFPCTIRTDQAKHVAVPNVKIQLGDRGKPTEADRNFVEFEQARHYRWFMTAPNFGAAARKSWPAACQSAIP